MDGRPETRLRVNLVRLLAALATAAASTVAQGQYPTRPVRVVVPFPPGGPVDVLGRLLAQKMAESTGQGFVVENRAGGNATIGAAEVAKSAADGYTLLFNANIFTITPLISRNVPYDVQRDFTPVALAAFKGEKAASPEAVAARARRIVLAVYDTPDVENVAARARPDLFIDCTTGDPVRIEALARKLAAAGTGYVEAPLSGSSQAIARGEATMFVGGDASGCEDILAAIAIQRHVVGAVGMAARAKLATNLVLGLNRAALAEGMAFAETLGIDRAAFLAIVSKSPAASPAALAKGQKMSVADWSPESRIRQHLKDVAHMLSLAGATNFHLPLTEAHAKLLDAAVAAGDGDLDNAAIIRRWENR